MSNVGEAYVEVRADTSRVSADIEKGVSSSLRSAQNEAKKFGDASDKGFGRAMKSAEGMTRRALIPASLALASIGTMMVRFSRAAEEAEVANQRLAQILSSMGYPEATARVTAYAEALERQVAVDGEVIKATQAKLATFANLTATINEQGGAFDRATIAALDLAAAGFGSAETNAVQLGKALQDPVKGVGALARAGVTFTAQERAKIKALVESNRTLEAQDLILKAIEKQVGGTAEATATDSARMALAYENIQEAIGKALLPALRALTEILQVVGDWIEQNSTLFLIATGIIAGLSLAVFAVNAAYKLYQASALVTAAINRATGASFTALQGAMGAVGLALTAAIGIYALATGKKKDYAGVTQQLTDALKLEGDAQTEALATLIQTDEQFRSVVETARKYGFTTEQVTRAIEGSTAEFDAFVVALQEASGNLDPRTGLGGQIASTLGIMATLREEINKQRKAFALASDEGNIFSRVLNRVRGAIAGPAESLRGLITDNMEWYNSTRTASAGTNKLAESIDKFRDSLKTVRSAAGDALSKAKDDFDQFSLSVANAVRNGLSFVTAYSERGAGTFLQSLEDQAAKARDFGVLINRLIAADATESVIQQVLGAGVEAGSAIANEILSTAGGVETANRLAKEVSDLADTVGQNAAGSFRQAGVDTATALVAGIESVLSGYQLRLRSRGLTDAQLKRLQRDFRTDVQFQFVTAGAEVPQLANGALISSPTLAMVGEAGPEAVIPISRPARALDLLEQSGLAALVRGSDRGPAVAIASATFVEPVDVDLLAQKIVASERSRAWSS